MTNGQIKYIEHLAAETLKKIYLARTAYLTELVFAGQYGGVSVPAPCQVEFDVLYELIKSLISQTELSLAVPEDKKKEKK